MAEVRPFRAICYNLSRVRIEDVVTQPYDKITLEMQRAYYNRSPYNVVRLILNCEDPQALGFQNRYELAASYLEKWLGQGILEKRRQEAIYVYAQRFSCGQREFERLSIIARVKVHEFSEGVIKPHEDTLFEPKKDRLNLLDATKTNLEPVFMLYDDPATSLLELVGDYIGEDSFLLEFRDEFGVLNRLFELADIKLSEEVQRFFRDKALYIADGHHRYEVSLAYSRAMREKRKADEKKGERSGQEQAYDYVLAGIAYMRDPALLILPSHRVVELGRDFARDDFLRKLGKHFLIRTYEGVSDADKMESIMSQEASRDLDRSSNQGGHIFGLVFSGDNDFRVLRLRDDVDIDALVSARASVDWKNLDVVILQHVVFKALLGINLGDPQDQSRISYLRFTSEVLDELARRPFAAAFLVRPPRIEQLKRICDNGERMPQKSTDFYPKLISGLVMYPLA